MTLDHYFAWMSCPGGDLSVFVKDDTVFVQETLFGDCVKTQRRYGYHVELGGMSNRVFALTFRLIDAQWDACNPSIKTFSTFNASPGSSKKDVRNAAIDRSGKSAFIPFLSKEKSKSGFFKLAKTSNIGYRIQQVDDSLLGESAKDTLLLAVQNGELAFESRYRKPPCVEQGIGIRTSGDTLHVLQSTRGECGPSAVRQGLQGKVSKLPKGRYWIRIAAEKKSDGFCGKDAETIHTREFRVP